jgi:hypothetical protein
MRLQVSYQASRYGRPLTVRTLDQSVINELIQFNFIDPRGDYELVNHRYHSVVVDRSTSLVVLELTEDEE